MKKWPTELGRPDSEYISGNDYSLTFLPDITPNELKIVRTFLFELAEGEKFTIYYKEIERTLECTLVSSAISRGRNLADPNYSLHLSVKCKKPTT